MLSARPQNRKFTNLLVSSWALVLLVAVAAEGDIKRTASGRPDLTGTYDVATLTPFDNRLVGR
ncbi:MAG: hypothetical protein IH908_08230 [Proteobacteria bacterium]|nr:hypothetical protein [Pseudomonadota bacterium]